MPQTVKWIETEFREDPLSAIRQVMASHATGQLILNVSQGTVCSVKWRERATEPENSLDRDTPKRSTLSPTVT